MNKAILSLLTASVLFAGCSAPAAQTLAPAATVGSASQHRAMVIRSSTMDLLVEEPVEVMADLERLIDKAGGFVTSSSAESGYTSLSAVVPSDSLTDIRLAALDIAREVVSDSTYSDDVTKEYEELVARLRQLEQAEGEIQTILASTNEPQRISSLQLVLDLLRQEKENIEFQVEDYEDSVSMGSLDIYLGSWAVTPYEPAYEPTYEPPYGGDLTPTPTPTGVY